jgi:hypothetical protein
MRLRYLLVFVLFASCTKEVIYEPAQPTTGNESVSILLDSALNRTVTGFRVRQTTDSTDYAYSSNGTVYYDNNIIISPGTQSYMSPIHLIKKNNVWTLDPANYGNIIDRARNIYKVTDNTYVWANAGTESSTNPTGNLYASQSNPDKSLTWNKLSDKNMGEFYHYAASGDVDGDGVTDILSFVGVETQSPELFKLFKGPSYNQTNIKFPDASEFEAALGITKNIKETVGRNFSFGSIAAADLDGDSKCELILTSTDVKINGNYYSIIILKYENNEFKIKQIIRPDSTIIANKMSVSDVKVGDFNGDKLTDIVVSLGDYNDNSGIMVWNNKGNLNFEASKTKKEFYGKKFNNEIFFSFFEVGKFRDNDCIFLHFEGARYSPRPQADLNISPFLLISKGNEEGFTHLNMQVQKQAPSYLKGYFENNTVRMIGIRGIRWHEFEVIDMTIK